MEAGFNQNHISNQVKFSLKARLYNILLSPWVYWIPDSLPFLHLGETTFKPCKELLPFSFEKAAFLTNNVKAYWRKGFHQQSLLCEAIQELNCSNICYEYFWMNYGPLCPQAGHLY